MQVASMASFQADWGVFLLDYSFSPSHGLSLRLYQVVRCAANR